MGGDQTCSPLAKRLLGIVFPCLLVLFLCHVAGYLLVPGRAPERELICYGVVLPEGSCFWRCALKQGFNFHMVGQLQSLEVYLVGHIQILHSRLVTQPWQRGSRFCFLQPPLANASQTPQFCAPAHVSSRPSFRSNSVRALRSGRPEGPAPFMYLLRQA